MSSEPYTDTILLEANRQQSAQIDDADNTSIWVNKIGDGIKLNPGDKISVSSAFISDLGAEDSTIEFNGSIIQDTQKFTVSDIQTDLGTGGFANELILRPRTKLSGTITEKEITLNNIQDTDANLLISYYKSNNGEYMMNLPFYKNLPGTAEGSTEAVSWAVYRTNSVSVPLTSPGYTPITTYTPGMPKAPTPSKISSADWNTLYNSSFPADYTLRQLKVDNKRFMIYGRPKTVYNTEKFSTQNPQAPKWRDLFGFNSDNNYIRIRNLLQLKVPRGFSTPAEVSSVITEQLTKNTKLGGKTINYRETRKDYEEDSSNTTTYKQIVKKIVSPLNETPTYKLFGCATYSDTQPGNADKFYGKPGPDPAVPPGSNQNDDQIPFNIGQEIYDYHSAFEYIGIKRPEIWDAGIKLTLLDARLSPITQTQLPIATGDGTTLNYLNTPPGSIQNQIPLYPDNVVSPALPTSRYPNWVVEPNPTEDTWKLQNLNPFFTNFLEESPFQYWTELNNQSSPFIDNYSCESDDAGAPYIYLIIDATHPALTLIRPGNNPNYVITLECFTHPFVGGVVNVLSVDAEIAGRQKINISGTQPQPGGIPVNTPISISRDETTIYYTTPYTVINTNYKWTPENLKMFKDFFDAQGRYPELFDMDIDNCGLDYRKNYPNSEATYNGEEITIDTHRYLHLNTFTNNSMPWELAVSNNHPNQSEASILRPTNNGLSTDIEYTETSFGYDNIPGVFTYWGSDGQYSPGTQDTAYYDYSSLPLMVKHFKKYKNNGSGLTTEQFNQANWSNGSEVEYRPVGGVISDDIGKQMWGGFAFKTPSSCVIKPEIPIAGANWNDITVDTDNDFIKVKKEYNYKTSLNVVSNAGWVSGTGSTTNALNESVFDTISFLAQVPNSYLATITVNSQMDENNVYQPAAVPIAKQVRSLYAIDYYESWLKHGIGTKAAPAALRKLESYTRRIGYDKHPTAYGNAFIGLYNGLCSEEGISYDEEYETQIDTTPFQDSRENQGYVFPLPSKLNADPYLNEIYCGAQSPLFSFDDTTSRFSISSLHTPERITAQYDAGLTKSINKGFPPAPIDGTKTAIAIPDNLGSPCYKINKIFDRRNFCPSITPYWTSTAVQITGTSATDFFAFPYNNPCVSNNVIFDMLSGVFLEDFNVEENNWKNSFWGICGFNYDDLNIDNTGNINARINNNNYNNIALLTTNQNVLNSDIGEWSGRLTGVAGYSGQMNYPIIANVKYTAETPPHVPLPLTSIPTDAPLQIIGSGNKFGSASIEASSLPSKTLRPYFTIRSSLLNDSYFIGGSQASIQPVIAVLPKNSQYGDFFYSGDNTIEFTNTIARTITDIHTQICDPDGKPSILSPNSAVVYKIVKVNSSNLNVVEQVLQANKKNPRIINSLKQ
tara:strand:+ start:2311 stop:6501 length:4191 start_codon:yes stop_codon:yes gene_type:complete